MIYFWLIPIMILLVAFVIGLYLVISRNPPR